MPIEVELRKAQLDLFIWDFKLGNNIKFNFEVLSALYSAREVSIDKLIFNKPITIIIVSILEAVFIDFLARLDKATRHLPAGLPEDKVSKIKKELQKQKKPKKGSNYLRLRMYKLSDIIDILKKYELFGLSVDPIYTQLQEFADMRNRVHIENYHGTLEAEEARVFTVSRLDSLEIALEKLWDIMYIDYKRPWSVTMDFSTQ